MSATSFRAAELSPPIEPPGAARRGERSAVWSRGVVVDVLLFLFCVSMLYLMHIEQGQETIPYHFLFLSVTIVYGFRVWPLTPTIVVVIAVTATTGALMIISERAGHIEKAELWEVPLMPALLTAMVWHARRRAVAQRQVQKMADQRRASLEREREFFRDTSHAIRTPVTIARGHLELLEPALDTSLAREDLVVAMRQLDRMSMLSNRLLAIAQLDAGMGLRGTLVDLGDFLEDVGRNWSASADRRWTVDPVGAAVVEADLEWLALAVDAVIENAVRFTGPADTIVLSCASTRTSCTILVADSGPGIGRDDLAHVFDRFWHRRPPSGDMGSGLGLAMTKAIIQAHGGDVTASNGPSGGAVFALQLPRPGV
jgi:signal transduction histidine kinase